MSLNLKQFNVRIFFIGTGIVTSVPSDAPDDYAALRDVKNKVVGGLLLNVHARFLAFDIYNDDEN